jgi:hypothetical protein
LWTQLATPTPPAAKPTVFAIAVKTVLNSDASGVDAYAPPADALRSDPPSWARELAAQAWCTPSTSHITLNPALAEAFADILSSQLAACRAALEAARPIVKARLIDADLRGHGDTGADAALDLIAQALAPAPLGTSDVPGTPSP